MLSSHPSTQAHPQVTGVPMRELAQARRDLEDLLVPWKPAIMGIYVNCLLGYKPKYAALFAAVYVGVLWYLAVTTQTVLTLVAACLLLLLLTQLAAETFGLPTHLFADFVALDSAHTQQTPTHLRALQFHEICGLIVGIEFSIINTIAACNTVRLTNPSAYFGGLVVALTLAYYLSKTISDAQLLFWGGIVLALIPAAEHYRLVDTVDAHLNRLLGPSYQSFRRNPNLWMYPRGALRWLQQMLSPAKSSSASTTSGSSSRNTKSTSDSPIIPVTASSSKTTQATTATVAAALSSMTPDTPRSSTPTPDETYEDRPVITRPESVPSELNESFYFVNRDKDINQ